MKCSHGLQFEVKCRQCFEEAMKRVSASKPEPKLVESSTEEWMLLGSIKIGVDKNPRTL